MLAAYLIIVVWVLLIACTIYLWSKQKAKWESAVLSCSVIVPFRNEIDHLASIVKALALQDLKRVEVIFVDDHSTDDSGEVLRKALESSGLEAQVLALKDIEGKKAALSYGISKAQNDIIITTDADCEMGSQWLTSMLQPFADKQINLVTGPVYLLGNSLLQRFQSLEMSALMGITAASIHLGNPTMANGANFAFRKSVFENLKGYQGIDHIPSGDDELFMYKVHSAYPNSIRFNSDWRSKVSTLAKPSLEEMIAQKRRWASKWKVNKRWSTIVLSLFILAVNLAQFAMIYEILTVATTYRMGLWAILLKFLVEALLIQKVRSDLGEKTGFFDYVVSFVFYPVYALYIAIAANFGSYEWKGRRYS